MVEVDYTEACVTVTNQATECIQEIGMTFDELQVLYPAATLDTWHQHPNGGGWVKNTAKVEDTSYVGEDARVFDHAQVSGNARVYGIAQVYDNAQLYGIAQVSGEARVYGNAKVLDHAQVSGEARVYDYAQVSGYASVSGEDQVSGVLDNPTNPSMDSYDGDSASHWLKKDYWDFD